MHISIEGGLISRHSARFIRSIGLLTALSGAICQAQTYLPQIADGGNWYTAVMLNNTTASAATVSLNFFQDTANGATAPWNPPFVEVGSTQNLSVPAGGVLYIHTPGTAATLTQGWGQVTGSSGVGVTAIYTYESFAGRPNQDGTSSSVAGASRILVPFDATTGYSTGIALVNPTGAAENVSVNIELDSGATSQGTPLTLPANGQRAFDMATQFLATAGHRGQAEFYVSSGSLSIAAFRINPTVALTSIPVTLASGSPIIGTGGGGGSGGGTGSLPQFKTISVVAGGGSPPNLSVSGSINGAGGGGYSGGFFQVVSEVGAPLLAECTFSAASVSGSTITLTGPETGTSCFIQSGLSVAGITSGSMTFTLSPNGAPTLGGVTGSVTLTSSLGTITGSYSGSYSAAQ